MVYPRVKNVSIIIILLSDLFLILSLISEFGGGTGWTLSPSSTGNLILGLLILHLLTFRQQF